MTEAELQANVIDAATKAGWHHLHVRRSIGKGKRWTTATNVVGWPDLLLWRDDEGDGLPTVIAVELKSSTGEVAHEQWDVIDSLRRAGVRAYVWRPSDWHDATVERVLFAHRRART